MRISIISKKRPEPKPKLDVNDYVKRLAAFVQHNPSMSQRAYAAAAHNLRAEAALRKATDGKFQIQLIAAKLDRMAAEALLPQTDNMSDFAETVSNDDGKNLGSYDNKLFEDIAASKVGPNGQNDSLEAAWFETEYNKTDGEIVAPSSAVPGRTLYGSQVIVQYGGQSSTGSYANGIAAAGFTAQQEASIARWDGTEEETQAISVAISPGSNVKPATYPTAKNASNVNYSYRPYFRVFFGTSLGRPNEVVGDVGRGIQFTIITCFLNVNVGMDPNPSGTTPGSMAITGNIGFNPAGTNASIVRTKYVDNLAPTATSNVVVPAFATALLPLLRSDVSGGSSVTLNFKDAAGSILYTFTLTASVQQQQPIPITGDVASVDVVNNGGLTSSFHLCFALAL